MIRFCRYFLSTYKCPNNCDSRLLGLFIGRLFWIEREGFFDTGGFEFLLCSGFTASNSLMAGLRVSGLDVGSSTEVEPSALLGFRELDFFGTGTETPDNHSKITNFLDDFLALVSIFVFKTESTVFDVWKKTLF